MALNSDVSLSFLLCSCVFNALRFLLFDSSRHRLPRQQFLVKPALINAVQTNPQASVSLKDTHRCSERSHFTPMVWDLKPGSGTPTWLVHSPTVLENTLGFSFSFLLLLPARTIPCTTCTHLHLTCCLLPSLAVTPVTRGPSGVSTATSCSRPQWQQLCSVKAFLLPGVMPHNRETC